MVILSVSNDLYSPDQLYDTSLQLLSVIHQETDISANHVEERAAPGSKGGAISIGEIALTFISSGAAVALFHVIKSYIEREPTFSFSLKRTDGTEVTLDASNVSTTDVEQILDKINTVILDDD